MSLTDLTPEERELYNAIMQGGYRVIADTDRKINIVGNVEVLKTIFEKLEMRPDFEVLNTYKVKSSVEIKSPKTTLDN